MYVDVSCPTRMSAHSAVWVGLQGVSERTDAAGKGS